MSDLDPHLIYIAAAYGVAGVAVAATIVAILLEYRRLKRGLARLGLGVERGEDV